MCHDNFRQQNLSNARWAISILFFTWGRVKIGETAEDAVIREVQEELGIVPKITRALWLNQAFFKEDVDNLNYHELCIYFLMDISDTALLLRGEKFTTNEGDRTHTFEWLEFNRLKNEYFYPSFLKNDIFNLPNRFTIRTEIEWYNEFKSRLKIEGRI